MKVIHLSQGCVAVCDDEDYDMLMEHKWHVAFSKSGKRHRAYARAMIYEDGSKKRQTAIQMHQLVLGGTSKKLQGDHINGFGLDNRRENLRLVTPGQNSHNQGKKTKDNPITTYKGIVWKASASSWLAQICVNRVQKTYGCWKTEEAAALNYDIMSEKLHGEYGKHNGLALKRREIMINELLAQTSPQLLRNTVRRFKGYLNATDEEIADVVKEAGIQPGILGENFGAGIMI